MAETPKLLNRMMKLPLRVFVASLEMFVQTAQELRRLFDQSLDAMLSAPDVGETAGGSTLTNQAMPGGIAQAEDETRTRNETFAVNAAAGKGATTTLKERANMRDANLNDDMLKLVRFKILFVKREYEHAFPEEEDLVPDNMTGADFAAWKVAEFIQRLGLRPPLVRFPKRWVAKANYHKYSLPKDWEETERRRPKPSEDLAAKGKSEEKKPYEPVEPKYEPYWLIGFPEDDKKYLRVYYEVLERYPREKLRYEERQLEILEKIADGVTKDGASTRY
jgi:hypothetical protein